MTNTNGLPLRETLTQAGYTHVQTLYNRMHVLQDTATGKRELWYANKNHAGYGIVYKNTTLEFARDYDEGYEAPNYRVLR